MDDRVEAFEVPCGHIPDVFPDFGNLRSALPKIAALEQVCIQADHFMAGGAENRAGDSPDITFMARKQYSHMLARLRHSVSQSCGGAIKHYNCVGYLGSMGLEGWLLSKTFDYSSILSPGIAISGHRRSVIRERQAPDLGRPGQATANNGQAC